MIYSKFYNIKSIYYFCEIEYIFKTEQWKDIEGYEGLYQVSDLGRVKSLFNSYLRSDGRTNNKHERIVKQNIDAYKYLCVNLSKKSNTKTIKTHKLVAFSFLNHKPSGFKEVVDHYDNDKYNNTLNNLRIVTNRQNSSKDRKNKTSKFTGVYKSSKQKKWLARIYINGKNHYLGSFDKEIDASKSYNKALQIFEKDNKLKTNLK